MDITLIGAPTEAGTPRRGCLMGPAALRTAGLAEALTALGHPTHDAGDVAPASATVSEAPNARLRHLSETAGWVRAVRTAVRGPLRDGRLPIVLGGDHSVAAGSLTGVMDVAPQTHVIWLDAHPDFHTLGTTTSGNLHGCALGLAAGLEGADLVYGEAITPLAPRNITMVGIRSVDPGERMLLNHHGVTVHDMRDVDEYGIAPLIRQAVERAANAGAFIHVSLDVDFLDPGIAPAVGTTVPGGATFREAHLAMELLHESGLVRSLDLVELNPFLDERGRTATLMVDLAASLFGRTIMDRPTRAW